MADDTDDPLPDDAPPEDTLSEEAEEAAEAEPEEAAEEAAAEAEAEPEEAAAEAEEAAAGAAPPEAPPPEPPAELVAPSPSLLTIILFVLNIAAALGFGYLLLLDYGVRQRWSSAIFRDDLVLWGLPLAEEEYHPTAAQATRPAAHLDPEQVKKEAAARGVRVTDKYQAVNEVVGQRIKPSQLTDEVLKEAFKGLGEPVKTLEAELDRVAAHFQKDVETAAAEVPAMFKSEQQKRAKLRDLLLPLASNPWQIDVVAQKIAKAKAADLDRLLADAGQRRVLVDTLRLLNERRPAVPRNNDNEQELKDVARRRALLDNAADAAAVKLEDLQALLAERFTEAKRGGPGKLDSESYGRRANIAYLLLTVSKARKPGNMNELIYPGGSERVAVVVGLYDYGNAAEELIHAVTAAAERLVQTVAEDRGGYPMRTDGGKLETVPGFVQRYQAQVQRIVDLVGQIKDQEGRLGRLEELQAQHKKQYEERKTHYDDVVDKLLLARNETRLQAVELRRLEQQLFRAQLDLADAARTNEQLEQQIRSAERSVGTRRKKRP